MYKIIPILLLLGVASCNTWSEESKDAWKQACTDNAVKWTATNEDAQTYCDCVLNKMMKKYPDVNEALEHTAELASDTTFMDCRRQVKVK